LKLAGLAPDPNLSGQDLFADNLRRHATSIWGINQSNNDIKHAVSVRSSTHRLIMYWTNQMELYDHRIDPFEHNNLLHTPTTEDLEMLEPVLAQMLDEMPQNFATPADTTLGVGKNTV